MTLNLTVPQQSHGDFMPRITVIGVGGAGSNAVDNMIQLELQGVEFVVANTDAQQLSHARADRRVQLGPHLTQGLGAGAKPEIGRAAAEEAADEIARHIEGAHMVFITAGMGGGTGTGAAPVIARMARERGLLTVGIVSKPFKFEGKRRADAADAGIADLQAHVDTLIVIPNQNLFRLATERTGLKEAFRMADNVLYMGVRGVTDLMVVPGLINLDFADVRAVMAEMGKAMMGTGEAEGDNRAIEAAELAISNPLLEDTSMSGARGLLVNITGGEDMTLYEVDQAAERVRAEVADDANIIFGSAIDESLAGRVRVSVVATGIDTPPPVAEAPPPAATPETGQRPTSAAGGAQAPFQPASTYAPVGRPQGQPATHPSQAPAAEVGQQAPQPVSQHAAPPQDGPVHAPSPNSLPQGGFGRPQTQRAGLFTAPPANPAPEPPRSLFGIVTGAFRGGRPAPVEAPRHEPRPEPRHEQRPETQQADMQHTQHEQAPRENEANRNDLDIPAFLRRPQ